MAFVEDRAYDGADKEDHEGLDGANPGDFRGAGMEEVARFIVGLEDTERVQDALQVC